MTPILAAILMGAVASPGACKLGETHIFAGAVEDDFGLEVSVCVADANGGESAAVTVRWSGEGGVDSVSCRAGECDGVIEYSRYTRPRFTIVQLAWIKDGAVQRLRQTLNAQGWRTQASVDHSWAWPRTDRAAVQSFPVRTQACDLALVKLERWLGVKPWSQPLLSGAR